jgi:lipopolysaccharide biosynthesis glycosyltransferase
MLNFVVLTNKKDFWFARICIASIRYFYPQNDVFLLPDFGNGTFSTKEIQLKFDVKILDYKVTNFGWGIAKLFVLFDDFFKEKRVLMLDADIVIIGELDRNLTGFGIDRNSKAFTVSGELCDNPKQKWVEDIYFDVDVVKLLDEEYEFPGYFFNTGCFFFTGGLIQESDFVSLFNRNKHPFVLRPDILPFPDQSLLNFVIPILENHNKITVKYNFPFMIWSNDAGRMEQINHYDLVNNKLEHLIHWAGDVRTPFLSKMKGSSVLRFFEDYYYQKISFGFAVRIVRRYQYVFEMLVLRIGKKLNLN